MLHSALLDSSISDCGILHYRAANYEFSCVVAVHVRSLCSLLLTAHCSVLPRLKRLQNYESCLASMYWLQFSLFIICPIIQWVVISPMLCDGTVWNHT